LIKDVMANTVAKDASPGDLRSDSLECPWMPGVKVHFALIGVESAKRYLETYKVEYRKLRASHVERLAHDMRGGNWNFDGAPIKFDQVEALLDGQHRLNAVVQSGKEQVFLVVEGLPPIAYDTTDTGAMRKVADSLGRMGENNSTLQASLLGMIYRHFANVAYSGGSNPTPTDMLAIHSEYAKEIRNAISKTHEGIGKLKFLGLTATTFAFMWFILLQYDVEKAHAFLHGVRTGEDISKGNPAHTVRNYLINHSDEKYSRTEQVWLLVKAFKFYVNGDPVAVGQGKPNYEYMGTIGNIPGVITRKDVNELYIEISRILGKEVTRYGGKGA
jgi:hypothetical protein